MPTRGSSPARLGVSDELAPRFRALGWEVDEDRASEEVRAILLAVRSGPDPTGAALRLLAVLEADPTLAERLPRHPQLAAHLVAVVGASRVMGMMLARHPEWVPDLVGDPPVDPGAVLDDAALKRFVLHRLTVIAAADLTRRADLDTTGSAVAATADIAVRHALASTAAELGVELPPFVVVAMGKWGAEELNYSSDIDLMFVYQVPGGGSPDEVRVRANRVAAALMRRLSQPTSDGIVWRADADLRPEGRSGPLARSLEAYEAYYRRWAESWEFQALLKARPAAGDAALGERFMAMLEPFLWPETLDPEAVRRARQMKRRAEELAGDGEVKRGVGGIRDIEFAVQLLQMVHGRFDPDLRVRPTLAALTALEGLGYVRREDAVEFAESYRWLRDLEHRIQLRDLRQLHTVPEDATEREAVAKAMGYRDSPDAGALELFERELAARRATVRSIHERLFYRPLLEALAASPTVRLTPEGAARQLEALGFRDVEGATRAFNELTSGLSRRSRLMQQMLPLMMEWLSDAPNPDLGLAQLRLLLSTSQDNTSLVAALRDTPSAAERLCRMLGTSRLLGEYIDRIPEFLPRLADDARLADFSPREELIEVVLERVRLRPSTPERLASLRRFVRRRQLRVAACDLLGLAGPETVGVTLADTADAAVGAGLWIAGEAVAEREHPPPFAVVAMGRWGGREMGYGSDLDLLMVYDGGEEQRGTALRLAGEMVAGLGRPTPEGVAYQVDTDLRPEGRQGPLTRSLDSYRAYYERWGEPWELLALVRARPVAGDPDLGRRFLEMLQPLVFPARLSAERVRAIRHIKARVEKERIPPGEDRDYHLKLGPGGLSDVEFLTQLLQVRHGAAHPQVRASNTLEALAALGEIGALTAAEVEILADAYRFHTHVRNRLYLQAGRPLDALPTDADEGARLAVSLGMGSRSELREEYRRRARRARRIFERRFYE